MTFAASALTCPLVAAAADGFSVFEPIVETNASAGDVGFHYLLDGGAWKTGQMYDPDGDRLLDLRGTEDLEEQGMTELFMESAEPPCRLGPDTDPDEVVTVAEFIERFETGVYTVKGRNLHGEAITIAGRLTHRLPAAPKTDIVVDADNIVTINWETGTDLGNCAVPRGIPNPARVKVVRWEVAVEPNADALPGGVLPKGVPFAKLTLQLLGAQRSVVVPASFIAGYLAVGVNEFKGEVGAREVGGNQTFTEIEFTIDQ
jgi:hypothetical protein